MIKYLVYEYRNVIKKVEIIKETNCTIVLIDTSENVVKIAKVSESRRFFNTFEEAKNFLIEKNEKKIETLKKRLKDAEVGLQKSVELKEPEITKFLY